MLLFAENGEVLALCIILVAGQTVQTRTAFRARSRVSESLGESPNLSQGLGHSRQRVAMGVLDEIVPTNQARSRDGRGD